jgi:hypothetical protein
VLLAGAILVAIAVPTFIRARDQARQQAQVPLAAPAAVDGLRRNRRLEQDAGFDLELDRARALGMTNMVFAAYGPGEDGEVMTLTVARTELDVDRRGFLRGLDQATRERFPARHPVAPVTIGGRTFDCGELPDNRDQATSWCTWNDGDTVGAVYGFRSIDPAHLAELAAAAVPMAASGQGGPEPPSGPSAVLVPLVG